MIFSDVVYHPPEGVNYSPPKNLIYHPDTANRNILVPGYQNPTAKTDYNGGGALGETTVGTGGFMLAIAVSYLLGVGTAVWLAMAFEKKHGSER